MESWRFIGFAKEKLFRIKVSLELKQTPVGKG